LLGVFPVSDLWFTCHGEGSVAGRGESSITIFNGDGFHY
jgi:hypothetical protein